VRIQVKRYIYIYIYIYKKIPPSKKREEKELRTRVTNMYNHIFSVWQDFTWLKDTVHRVVESRIVMMKIFQVNVNADVQSFMVDIKKTGVRENNNFDKVVMTKFQAISSLKLVSDP
jgi:hypothetical protein